MTAINMNTNLRSRIISGGFLVAFSQVANNGISFARNVVIARTISLSDMGIAATIALALSVIESASDLSVNHMIVQASDGDDPILQSNAHSFTVVRGFITAFILALTGDPLARLFGVPQAAWAFQMMAIAPMIRGLAHQDLWRFHRHLKFGPLIMVEFVSQVIALIAAWLIAARIGDYSVMLWVILLQVSVVTVLSHCFRERSYRLRVDRAYFSRIVHFGWPLLINGILIIVLNYGDRAIIALFPVYTMAEVGLYMIASTVVQTPTMLLCKLGSTILLPALSKAQSDRPRFAKQLRVIAGSVGIAAMLQTIVLIIAGPSLVVLCFGEKYLPVIPFFGWLAAACGVRILRCSPTLGAMALGDTLNTLLANIARCSGIVIAIVAGVMGGGLQWFAIAAFIGELISLLTSVLSLTYRKSILDPTSILMTVFLVGTVLAAMRVFDVIQFRNFDWMSSLAVAVASSAFALFLAALLFAPVAEELRRIRIGLTGLLSRSRS